MWRLLTNLLYFGTIRQPANYAFHTYFMYNYLRDLEENAFTRRSSALIYMFFLVAAVLSVRTRPVHHALAQKHTKPRRGSECERGAARRTRYWWTRPSTSFHRR